MHRIPPGTRALRRGRVSIAGQIYHVNTATRDRRPVFADWAAGQCVVAALRAAEGAGGTRTLAWCLMPDHLHWLVQLGSEPLPRVVGLMKGRAARQAPAWLPLWQRGYYEHAIRGEESLVDVARYIVANPLRARLVERIGDYPLWDSVWL
jgi:REP element-mobilizing transposase RayT